MKWQKFMGFCAIMDILFKHLKIGEVFLWGHKNANDLFHTSIKIDNNWAISLNDFKRLFFLSSEEIRKWI